MTEVNLVIFAIGLICVCIYIKLSIKNKPTKEFSKKIQDTMK